MMIEPDQILNSLYRLQKLPVVIDELFYYMNVAVWQFNCTKCPMHEGTTLHDNNCDLWDTNLLSWPMIMYVMDEIKENNIYWGRPQTSYEKEIISKCQQFCHNFAAEICFLHITPQGDVTWASSCPRSMARRTNVFSMGIMWGLLFNSQPSECCAVSSDHISHVDITRCDMTVNASIITNNSTVC